METCPQYLLLDEGRYHLSGFESAKYVLSPPLRTPEDQAALWEALASGEIDTVGTDHCSFDFGGAKQLGRDDFSKIPNGIPGVEHRPVLLYTAGVAAGRITAYQLMKLLSEQPARLFGMYPAKGALSVGSDADVVIYDPNSTDRITSAGQHQNVDYTPMRVWKRQGESIWFFSPAKWLWTAAASSSPTGAALSAGVPPASGGDAGRRGPYGRGVGPSFRTQ